jgi:hypothetical protein
MESSEDRPVSGFDEAAMLARPRSIPGALHSRFTGRARSAPKGSDSRIGDDETHRRLQEARNRARHSTESLVRRELGPEWVQD